MIEIWINCPDRKTAQNLSEVLISKRHIACANMYPEIQSCYRWKGSIENEPEVPLVVKTREENYSKVVGDVKKIHPYETPSIIGIPVEFVNRDYLEWIYSETA